MNVMNADLLTSDFHRMAEAHVTKGIYAPGEKRPYTRVVMLTAGQVLYRWVPESISQGGAVCSPWWTTRYGAQLALLKSVHAGQVQKLDLVGSFCLASRQWGGEQEEGKVVLASVTAPIRCFIGVTRDEPGRPFKDYWGGLGHQLYIPGMTERFGPTLRLTPEAASHLRLLRTVALGDWINQSWNRTSGLDPERWPGKDDSYLDADR